MGHDNSKSLALLEHKGRRTVVIRTRPQPPTHQEQDALNRKRVEQISEYIQILHSGVQIDETTINATNKTNLEIAQKAVDLLKTNGNKTLIIDEIPDLETALMFGAILHSNIITSCAIRCSELDNYEKAPRTYNQTATKIISYGLRCNNSIKSLDLSEADHARYGLDGLILEDFIHFLENNKSLEKLNLDYSDLAKNPEVFAALQNSNIKYLHATGMNDDLMIGFLSHSRILTNLGLECAALESPPIVVALAQNTTVIAMRFNQTDSGKSTGKQAKGLAQIIETNQTLENISWEATYVAEDDIAKIPEALKTNKTLKVLHITGEGLSIPLAAFLGCLETNLYLQHLTFPTINFNCMFPEELTIAKSLARNRGLAALTEKVQFENKLGESDGQCLRPVFLVIVGYHFEYQPSTQLDIEEAQKYCAEKGLPIPGTKLNEENKGTPNTTVSPREAATSLTQNPAKATNLEK